MRVLVACEHSGVVRNAFLARCHDAWSCDIKRGWEPTHRRHLRCDARVAMRLEWDLVIAHPPCTYLSLLSACRFTKGIPLESQPRYKGIVNGSLFFHECLNANASRVCVENPRQHKWAKTFISPHSQVVHPWEFGEPFTKETWLWLKGLPLLRPTKIVESRQAWVRSGNHGRPSTGRVSGVQSSLTFQGIAEAMADQWGGITL